MEKKRSHEGCEDCRPEKRPNAELPDNLSSSSDLSSDSSSSKHFSATKDELERSQKILDYVDEVLLQCDEHLDEIRQRHEQAKANVLKDSSDEEVPATGGDESNVKIEKDEVKQEGTGEYIDPGKPTLKFAEFQPSSSASNQPTHSFLHLALGVDPEPKPAPLSDVLKSESEIKVPEYFFIAYKK